MEESKEQFAEGYRVQENRNPQDEGTAETSLLRARRRMSFMAGADFTWSKDIDHDDAGADGGDKIMEGIKRIGPRQAMQSLSRERRNCRTYCCWV